MADAGGFWGKVGSGKAKGTRVFVNRDGKVEGNHPGVNAGDVTPVPGSKAKEVEALSPAVRREWDELVPVEARVRRLLAYLDEDQRSAKPRFTPTEMQAQARPYRQQLERIEAHKAALLAGKRYADNPQPF